MDFRDEINNILQQASDYEAESARRKQEELQKKVDGVCDWVRKRIKGKAYGHRDPNTPFEAKLYFACHPSEAFVRKEIMRPGRSNGSSRVEQLTLSEDILKQEKLIREQLKSGGIIVGKWKLYEAYVAYGDNVTPIPNYLCSYARAFGVYEEDEIRNAAPINIDPYKPITATSGRIWGTSTYTFTYSQDGKSYRSNSNNHGPEWYLIMPISFS